MASSESLRSGNRGRHLQVGGRSRSYIVHAPPSYDGTRPFPLVLALHGGLTNAAFMIRFCGLNEKADEAGFLVAYPRGTGAERHALTWNAGNCCGYAMTHQVDDVAFVRALLVDLQSVANIDPRHIFATGMSNGAMMAYRLAAELSERIAAIAPVAGPMVLDTCNPQRPVSVLHFHGTADAFVPFAGGRGPGSISGTNFVSVEHAIAAWVRVNGCPERPIITVEPTRVDDGTRVLRHTYGPGRDGTEVVLVVIESGGHTWPGRAPTVDALGKTTYNVSANDLMWEFFAKHPI